MKMSHSQAAKARNRARPLIGLLLVVIVAGGAIGFWNVVKARQNLPGNVKATATTAVPVAPILQTAAPLYTLQNPYPPYKGLLVLDDAMRDNSKGFQWGEDTDEGTCRFRSGAYYIDTATSDYIEYCTGAATHFSNYIFQVQMTILKGDRGGLSFLVNSAQKTVYYFGIGQDGSYVLDYFRGEDGTNILKGNASALVHLGLNHPNVIGVSVMGSHVDLYVNMQLLIHLSVPGYFPNGSIGLAAQDKISPTEVVFHDAKVWSLQFVTCPGMGKITQAQLGCAAS
jgi:hypothetical protein